MPLYDVICPKCDHEGEVISYGGKIECPVCGNPMLKRPGANVMVKMKGEGGYPSRRRQIFNTTKNNHPKLEKEIHKSTFYKGQLIKED